VTSTRITAEIAAATKEAGGDGRRRHDRAETSGEPNWPTSIAVPDSAVACPRRSGGGVSPTSTVITGSSRPLPNPNNAPATNSGHAASVRPIATNAAVQHPAVIARSTG
jgi:hypothetical protein